MARHRHLASVDPWAHGYSGEREGRRDGERRSQIEGHHRRSISLQHFEINEKQRHKTSIQKRVGLNTKKGTQIQSTPPNYQQSTELPQLRTLHHDQQPTATCPTRKTADWTPLPQPVPPPIRHRRIPSLFMRQWG